MLEFVLLVLAISLFLYALLAGADFGAGILELFPIGISRAERSELIGKAMGPVWEANHIWLILALVISFNAFPDIFWFVSEYFHFPLGALAMGIIFRGASFTFMHYDPIKDRAQKVYHWIFGLSSLWCSLWIGIMMGSLMLGNFSLSDTEIFPRYFKHWLNPFAFSMGIFITLLMMFNASLFLYVETHTQQEVWRKVTIRVFWILIAAGLMTHVIFFLQASQRWHLFFNNPVSLSFIGLSFLLLLPQHLLIKRAYRNSSRILAGVQLMLIMAAGFVPLYPKAILFRNGEGLDFYSSAAEDAVINELAFALFIGCLLIFPGYIYLMKVFKSQKPL